ncbi:hypothetical protein MAR_ORF155 [Marseillevirus marseillevirus]|uniref:Uncharacterized protein n=1 Tax=Marseillevirus marseillevirus TaxID=694581 RepID=D2XAF9_GBMV|nr:hypothetical protein MAR_ORF155 [Marseillevirus marseillevirus]ADB03936.1 hypothetical protein MAR_ORF155 [Marseillevirus marseillevirus]
MEKRDSTFFAGEITPYREKILKLQIFRNMSSSDEFISAAENIQRIREALHCRQKNYDRNIPQKEASKMFELDIHLNVAKKFLLEHKVKEAVFTLMKYEVTIQNIISVVEKEKREQVVRNYKQLSDWLISRNFS